MIKQLLKNRMLKLATLLMLLVAAVFPQKASALRYVCMFEADGIYYSIFWGKAVVTTTNDFKAAYEGDVSIPSEVEYNGHLFSVTTIGDDAFSGCSKLTSVTIPESVTSIGDRAFENCRSLPSVTIPKSVTSFGESAFECCTSLTSVTISEGVTSIGNKAFYECTSLTSVTIPKSVTSVGIRAFFDCDSLSSITIDGGVTSMGVSAFLGCDSLTSLTIAEGVTSIGVNAFAGCTSLPSVTIPESVTSIGAGAFLGCDSLTSLTIAEGVTSIGENAFAGCSKLTSVTIPESVTSIGTNAFNDCNSLNEVICCAAKPCSLGNEVFVNTPSSKILYVPMGSVDNYKSSSWSKYFSTIIVGLTIETEGDGKFYNNGVEVANGMRISLGSVTFFILADDNNKIASATLDDEDVKGEIVNHILTIEDCAYAGILKVVFAPITENEASLTVKGAETHSLTHYYKDGTEAKIDVRPEAGWKLYSLSFNGEDATNDVSDNTYTTPALFGDNHLEVVMKSDDGTGVDGLEDAQRKISFRKNGNTVEILNLEEGERILIYNADGACEYQGKNHTVTLSNNNVYILSTEKETLKFAL